SLPTRGGGPHRGVDRSGRAILRPGGVRSHPSWSEQVCPGRGSPVRTGRLSGCSSRIVGATLDQLEANEREAVHEPFLAPAARKLEWPPCGLNRVHWWTVMAGAPGRAA